MTLSDATCSRIVQVLKGYDVKVREHPGWRKRSAKDRNSMPRPFDPYGQAIHHDATTEAMSDAVVLNIMVNGRVDLAGPLCNGWIDSDSTVWLIAAGNANHAGWNEADVHARLKAGKPPLGDANQDPDGDSIVGNPYLWGWECRNAGDGVDPWEQLYAMEAASAALCHVLGLTSDQIAGHKELTARKPDPRGISMPTFRADVRRIRLEHHPSDPEVPDVALLIKEPGTGRWMNCDGIHKKHETSRDHVRELVYAGLLRWAGPNEPYEGVIYNNILDDTIEVP